MSTMKFREPNQALWRGTRPGHKGTQVLKKIDVTADTQVLIDGTQTTITYLTDWSLGIARNQNAEAYIITTENDDTITAFLTYISSYTSVPGGVLSQSLVYPIELPAGYKVKVIASGAGGAAYGHIHGWEE